MTCMHPCTCTPGCGEDDRHCMSKACRDAARALTALDYQRRAEEQHRPLSAQVASMAKPQRPEDTVASCRCHDRAGNSLLAPSFRGLPVTGVEPPRMDDGPRVSAHPDDDWPDETVEVAATGDWLVRDGVIVELGRIDVIHDSPTGRGWSVWGEPA